MLLEYAQFSESLERHKGTADEYSSDLELSTQLKRNVESDGRRFPSCVSSQTGYREKRIQQSADVEELIRALGTWTLDRDYWAQTALRVNSLNPLERYQGVRQFRMMLSVSGDIPIQAVIDTGVVPRLVEFLDSSNASYATLQFEAAWALTNIASGTTEQTQVVVAAGAIPKFLQLLEHPQEEIREQGMWGLGNISGDRADFRDLILSTTETSVVSMFVRACEASHRKSTVRTGIWSLSNLCRGKPRPSFHQISSAIPYISTVISSTTDPDCLSDSCWALDGLSEYPEGVLAMVSCGTVPLLINLLASNDVAIQRPALRVLGQIVAGTVDQTQHVLDHGLLNYLPPLLRSMRKGIRKDTCWTLSNIAAGSPAQLQALLNKGLLEEVMAVFETGTELEVRKEAAWVICNACSSQTDDHLQYMVSIDAMRPLCEMLLLDDDEKMLEVALDAIENLLAFGDRMAKRTLSSSNVCAALMYMMEGVSHLRQLRKFRHTALPMVRLSKRAGKILDKWFDEPQGMALLPCA